MTVTVVAPTAPIILGNEKTVRACAYCRVSTSSKDQLHSFGVQLEYYKHITEQQMNWQLVDIYGDEGMSGRVSDNRPEFNRMIEDANLGLFDMIICKSIARFARNVVTTLEICRELRQKGIDVFFEKENIHTLFLNSENYFSLQATFSENESRNISTNLTWAIRKEMKSGEWLPYFLPYGYERNGDDIIKVKSEEEVVHFIFDSYINGMLSSKIAEALNSKGILNRKNRKWTQHNIVEIVSNPIYQGNIVVQKTFTEEVAPFTRRKNKGQLPKYHYVDSHEPYIDEDTAHKVSNVLEFRRLQKHMEVGAGKTHNRYPLSGIITCQECGSKLIRVKQRKNSNTNYYVYKCTGHIRDKDSCGFIKIREDDIHQIFIHTINKLLSHESILESYLKNLSMIQKDVDRTVVTKIMRNIENEYHLVEVTTEKYQSGLYDEETYQTVIESQYENIRVLRKEYREKLYQYDLTNEIENTKLIIKILENMEITDTFNKESFEAIIQEVIVVDQSTIKLVFINGMEIIQKVVET